ncbi:hypothetical protein A9Q81_06840 [Gammaproteobacteria bacterium 42_54_T18]|nr:hypothetical protein A9Q81_06840 [Gammaproteobacteria bacterium 42_54_T18]
MKKVIGFIVVLLCGVQTAYAANSPSMTIEKVKVWGSGFVVVSVAYESGGDIVSTCGNHNEWEISGSDADGMQRLYSLLLTAYTTGKKVGFWYDTGDCGVGGSQRSTVGWLAE